MRIAEVARTTNETQIVVSVNLDGTGKSQINTGIGFFDHMLDQIARHGLIDLAIYATGDLHIDGHHTVEDIGICVGQALLKALDDRKGIVRYGHAYVPLDEALSRVVIDISGRSGFFGRLEFIKGQVGNFELELVEEFFRGLVNQGMLTIHADILRGANAHHQCETLFKAFGRALRMAIETDIRAADQVPSTKGMLTEG